MSGHRLSAQDALWLTMDRPTNLMVIDVVTVLSGIPDLALVEGMFGDLTVRHPVFARRPERDVLGWSWVDDPAFDVRNHVQVVPLPAGSTMAAVQAYVAEQRAVRLPQDRPLWSAALLHPVVLDDGTTGAAVVTRFHHAIADGVRLTQVMLAMLDPDFASSVPAVARRGRAGGPTIGPDAVRQVTGDVLRVTGSMVRGLAHPRSTVSAGLTALSSGIGVLRHPDRFVDVLEAAGASDHRVVNDAATVTKLTVGSSDRTVWTGRPGVRKSVAWSAPVPLDQVKQAARRHRATLNDVLVAALAGALRSYLLGRGDAVDDVVWMVPVNLTPFSADLPEDLGNHFALVMLDLPLTGETPVKRLHDVRHRMQRIKNSDEPVLTFGLQRTIALSPARLATLLTDFFANKAVGVLTNVPGPTRALSIGDVTVRQVIGFAPCSGDQPLTATIFTYAGTVTVGFASDADLVPDPQHLVDLVLSELDSLVAPGG